MLPAGQPASDVRVLVEVPPELPRTARLADLQPSRRVPRAVGGARRLPIDRARVAAPGGGITMAFPRRVGWLDGKYANVDGIPFTMPIATHHSPAMFAAFTIDAQAAAEMLPGQELHPV